MSQVFSAADVASHNKPEDLYIIVDEDVYNVTEFADEHPGGKKILQRVGGKDASKQFWKYHNEGILKKYKKKLQIGSLDSKKQPEPVPEPKIIDVKKPDPVPEVHSGEVQKKEPLEPLDLYGDLIPYADPGWYQSYRSMHYNQSHADLRNEVRDFVDEHIAPYIDEWDLKKEIPAELYKSMGERGYLAGLMGAEEYPKKYVGDLAIKAVAPEKWDLFHELVVADEISRAASGGLVWNLIGGFGIGCPPLMRYGQDALKDRILPGILKGDKRICLAITEPSAGSDVANLACEAKLTEDGKHFIVNGEKKWITNGIWCDYFTVAVRTGGQGMNGITVLLIERENGGVTTRAMDCQGVWGSGTTYVTFEDTKVPVENVLGDVDKGFQVIMTNFNHERMGIIIQCVRFSRVCYEEAMKYAHKRETFGVPLIKHPVIRNKFAHMARQIESTAAWMEALTWQAGEMGETEAMLKLGGAIAGLKAQATTTFEFCAREASQIFGGLSYSRGGQAGKVERLYRDVRAYAIPGGSEEIMLDLSIRQALKVHEFMGSKM